MKVFITGGTGYVGKKIVELLLKRNHEVTCLVRHGSEKKLGEMETKVNYVFGDALEPTTINVSGQDAIIHLIAILTEDRAKGITYEKFNYETGKNLIDAALNQNVSRFLFMSAAGDFGILKEYFRYKLKVEEKLKNSDLKWTILRPSVIYDKSFIGKSKGWIKLFDPLYVVGGMLPVIGDLAKTWRPVPKWKVAETFVRALENDSYIGKTVIGEEFFK